MYIWPPFQPNEKSIIIILPQMLNLTSDCDKTFIVIGNLFHF